MRLVVTEQIARNLFVAIFACSTLLSQPANANEQKLFERGSTTVYAASAIAAHANNWCRFSVAIIVRTTDNALFDSDKAQLRQLVLNDIRPALSAACPQARTLFVKGYVGDQHVYSGQVPDYVRHPTLANQFQVRPTREKVKVSGVPFSSSNQETTTPPSQNLPTALNMNHYSQRITPSGGERRPPRTASNEVKSFVPTWTSSRQIYVSQVPTFFSYKDLIQPGPDHDTDGNTRFLTQRNLRVENGWFCQKLIHLSGPRATIVFADLPTGPSQFDIWCRGECKSVKYAIATNRDNYIYHAGLANDFPVVAMSGPTNFMLAYNIGFSFFGDEPDAPADIVKKNLGSPALPSGAEVTIIQWRTDIRSSFGGRDCDGQ